MGGGSGAGGGIGWVGYGRGVVGAYIARRRAMRQMTSAVEADLTERGIPIPKAYVSRKDIWNRILLWIIARSVHRARFLGTNLTCP